MLTDKEFETLTAIVDAIRACDIREGSTRTLAMLELRKARAGEILPFIKRHTLEDIMPLTLPQKKQYAFLLYDLSLTELETGHKEEALAHAVSALRIIQGTTETTLYAAILYSEAVLLRELKQLPEALAAFEARRNVLSSNPEAKSELLLHDKVMMAQVFAHQDEGIVYLRLPISVENLMKAIACFDQSFKEPLAIEQPNNMMLVRVYSYLALAHILFLENYGDDEKLAHSKEALAALQAGENIARTNNMLKGTNQDVATLYFHFSRYYNCINQPVEALSYAVHALQIRTLVLFRARSKIDELYAELNKAFAKISEAGDKSQLHLDETLPPLKDILQRIYNFQLQEHPKEAAVGYYQELAPKTAGYLHQIDELLAPTTTKSPTP